MYNWPFEKFIFKDLIPELFRGFNNKYIDDYTGQGHFLLNRDKLGKFYHKVTEAIVSTFTVPSCDRLREKQENCCKIRNIDISGYNITGEDSNASLD